jgi:hypothetical protein
MGEWKGGRIEGKIKLMGILSIFRGKNEGKPITGSARLRRG